MRLPPNSHTARVYGDGLYFYQIVGAFDAEYAIALIYDVRSSEWKYERDWGPWTVKRSWLRGSARELADALCEERRRKAKLDALVQLSESVGGYDELKERP